MQFELNLEEGFTGHDKEHSLPMLNVNIPIAFESHSKSAVVQNMGLCGLTRPLSSTYVQDEHSFQDGLSEHTQ